MPKHDETVWLWSASLPRWYCNGGVCAAESTLHGTRREPDRLVRSKPTIPNICGPLMGSSTKREDGSHVVKFPTIARRLAMYEEGLNLVAFFREREDIFTLAVYRRQVHPMTAISLGTQSLDMRFLELAETFEPTPAEWGMLAVRMPANSKIHAVCRSRSVPPPIAIAVAA